MDASFLTTTFVRLLGALPVTLEVWALSILLGAVIGAGVTWMRANPSRLLQTLARIYIFVFRGTPLLVQLFIVY